ncbi:RodZ family helix-turn-helix domain-containing protein [Chitinimonas sp. BJYL2]|uniref:helix-turn-helix domain-containing protein n=1 Tax=Chitinimonas sp. BJYL2 TaxID=2976696 RepID=UPI0022B5913B|nr:RodZ family helix-turn-helix domain-containing protein [Chitinimonas sp. BJYL2]
MSQDTADIPILPADDEVPAPSTPGAILATQREQAGLTVADVAHKLKLSKRQIEALEADDFTVLPGNTFVRGFVRNYARLLSLDPQPLLHFLDSHLPKETSQAVLPRLRDEALPVLRPAGQGNRPGFFAAMFLGIGAALLLGGGVFWFLTQYGGFNAELMMAQPEPANAIVETAAPVPATPAEPELIVPAVEPTSPTVDQVIAAETTDAVPDPTVLTATSAKPDIPVATPSVGKPAVSAVSGAPAPMPTATPVPKPSVEPTPATPSAATPTAVSPQGEVRVVAKQDSWVQIVDSTGKRLVNELLPAGATRAVSGAAPYQVRIGNGRHTSLYYKGKPTDLTPHIKVDVANLELN